MDKKRARHNLILAGMLLVASAAATLSGLMYIRFFMSLPR